MVLLVPAETPRRTWRYRLDSIIVWGNRPVILLIRRILWIITAGWCAVPKAARPVCGE